MTRQLPTEHHVRQAMDDVFQHSRQTGQRPTIAAVERKLDIAHATFHRHYADLITNYFQPRARTRASDTTPEQLSVDTRVSDALTRLRQENTDLRKLVQLYEEAIRQLTLDNHDLHSRLLDHAAVVPIGSRRGR